MTNNNHILLYPVLHSQLAKSPTFLLVWINQRVIQLCQKVLLHWAGIKAKWCEMPVREICRQYSHGGILTAVIAKAPTTLGAQAPRWLNSQCCKYLRRETRDFCQKNHPMITIFCQLTQFSPDYGQIWTIFFHFYQKRILQRKGGDKKKRFGREQWT